MRSDKRHGNVTTIKRYSEASYKDTSTFLFGFLFLHGFLFLGIGYILFQTFPLLILLHQALGILIYVIFWRAKFPNLFRDVLIGASLSVISAILIGDLLLDNFFVLYAKVPTGILASAYSATVIFYIYFYIALIRRMLRGKMV